MELTGCDEFGRPLRLKHQHAHILPLDLDDDGHLDHILIHAPMRLGPEALRAIRSVRRTFAKKVADDLQLAVAGIGSISQVLHEARAQSLASNCPVWTSVTPFVPPRFIKRSGKNSLKGQIQAELESRGLPPVDTVDVLTSESIDFRHFIRVRKHGINPPQPPMDFGFALTLRFSEPLAEAKLPLCLGYASHFGMGLFRSVG
jgi:CRISPR-associated protein Csb2